MKKVKFNYGLGKERIININSIEINYMDIMKIIMNNGHTYELIWDIRHIEGNWLRMIDVKKGWVRINCNYISERYIICKFKDLRLPIDIKNLVRNAYGEDLFME